MDMKERLQELAENARKRIEESEGLDKLNDVRVAYLGKKGELTAILKQMGKLSAEERPVVGQLANKVRADIEEALSEKLSALKASAQAAKIAAESIDITLPGKPQTIGKLHPLSKVENEIRDIFMGMGFNIADGPEVDDDYHVLHNSGIVLYTCRGRRTSCQGRRGRLENSKMMNYMMKNRFPKRKKERRK